VPLALLAGGRRLEAVAQAHGAVPDGRLPPLPAGGATVNRVQGEFGNGIVGAAPLSPEFLLDCWLHGLRLDTPRLRGIAPPSWRVGDFPLRRVV
jgi:hypothetical protein